MENQNLPVTGRCSVIFDSLDTSTKQNSHFRRIIIILREKNFNHRLRIKDLLFFRNDNYQEFDF